MADATEHPEQTPAAEQPKTPEQVGAEPSGYTGGNPSTGGPGQTAVRSETPENSAGHINPSAPEDSNTTPGSSTPK